MDPPSGMTENSGTAGGCGGGMWGGVRMACIQRDLTARIRGDWTRRETERHSEACTVCRCLSVFSNARLGFADAAADTPCPLGDDELPAPPGPEAEFEEEGVSSALLIRWIIDPISKASAVKWRATVLRNGFEMLLAIVKTFGWFIRSIVRSVVRTAVLSNLSVASRNCVASEKSGSVSSQFYVRK